jgi:hypothetical protein
MLETLLRTVFGLMKSCRAMSPFGLSAAMRSRISRSLVVNSGKSHATRFGQRAGGDPRRDAVGHELALTEPVRMRRRQDTHLADSNLAYGWTWCLS